MSIPDTKWDATITMPSRRLARALRAVSLLGANKVRVQVSKEAITFSSTHRGAETTVCVKTTTATEAGPADSNSDSDADSEDDDDDTNVTIELVKPVELSFSIDIVSRFTKCPARSRTVTIYMAHDTPICVRTA